MWTRMRTVVVLLTLVGPTYSGLEASGGSQVDPGQQAPVTPMTPEEQARQRYNDGLSFRNEAWRLQKKLSKPDTPEPKRAKLEKKLGRAYNRAFQEFAAAISLSPRFHQAYSSLGYVYRQLGDYPRALEAYDTALEIDPGYAEAIEYRGEAYLGLNRINDAQNAYRVLLTKDSDLAAELLGAMRAWLKQRRDEPTGVEVVTLDGFERWLEDRGDAASDDRSSLRKSRTW